MRQNILFLLFCFPFLHLCAQNAPIIEFRDINADGVKDSLTIECSSGSGFGGCDCTVKNGKTGERLEWSTFHCFCTITDVVLIPEGFGKPENLKFRLAVESHIRSEVRSTVDPSLAWILNGLITHADHDEDTAVWRTFTGRTDYTTGRFTAESLPPSYTIPLDGKALQAFCLIGYLDPIDLHGGDEGWLYYGAQNHVSSFLPRNQPSGFPEPTDTLGGKILLATAHGLVLQEKDRWSWVWITDHYLTGSPDKLRFNSIQFAEFVNEDYVILNYMGEDFSEKFALIHLPDARVTLFAGRYDYGRGYDVVRTGDQLRLMNESELDEPGPVWSLKEMIRLAEEH